MQGLLMDRSKIFKVFFNHTTNSGVGYYRMINFAKFMRRQKNVEVAYSKYDPNQKTIVDWEQKIDTDSQDQICKDIHMLMENSDISVWQMVHHGLSLDMFYQSREKWNNKKPLLMEIDDYIHAINPESAGYSAYHNNSELEYLAELQMKNANHLIVSTQWLADKYKDFCPCVTVIPNAIDFEIWGQLKDYRKPGRVRIGWAGGQPHEKDLRVLKFVIPIILDKYKHVDFMFLGHLPFDIKTERRVRHVMKWYSIYDYPKELAKLGFDIGVAPLRDNQFNRAKSNLRFLEYSALGIPTVASPVEPFKKDFVGLNATEVTEWVEKLSLLIEQEDYRLKLGRSAYNYVKENFNAEKVALKYLDVLKEICAGKRPINRIVYEIKDGQVFGKVDV